jgi:hypothetical protein
MLKALNNKKGFSYILCCVLILVTVMFVFIAMEYTFIYHIVNEQKEDVQLKLNGYITRSAIENFDALKQGGAWEAHIDSDRIVSKAYTELGFSASAQYVNIAPPGTEDEYLMTRPVIYALSCDSFGIVVEYEVSIPFVMFGREIAEISVPTKIVSKYTEK